MWRSHFLNDALGIFPAGSLSPSQQGAPVYGEPFAAITQLLGSAWLNYPHTCGFSGPESAPIAVLPTVNP